MNLEMMDMDQFENNLAMDEDDGQIGGGAGLGSGGPGKMKFKKEKKSKGSQPF